MYKCKECNASATIENGVIVRTCEHEGTVVLDMEVDLVGKSSIAG